MSISSSNSLSSLRIEYIQSQLPWALQVAQVSVKEFLMSLEQSCRSTQGCKCMRTLRRSQQESLREQVDRNGQPGEIGSKKLCLQKEQMLTHTLHSFS